MGCLEGKVAVVTGGGRGIGRAEAMTLAAEGASVVVNDLGCDAEGRGSDPSVADAVVREIEEWGGEAVASYDDVRDRGTAERLVQQALDQFGRLDAVVSNAGFTRDRTVLNMEDEDLDAMLDVHVRASFSLTRHAARAMLEQGGGGAIILTTAPVAFFGSVRQANLAAAAAAVVGLARSAAAELRRQGIRVNAIAPTARTRATEHLPIFRGIRTGSMDPEHVAPLAAFLASDLASDVFGEVLGVAGGRIYAFRGRETTGAFVEGGAFSPETIQQAWSVITRT